MRNVGRSQLTVMASSSAVLSSPTAVKHDCGARKLHIEVNRIQLESRSPEVIPPHDV